MQAWKIILHGHGGDSDDGAVVTSDGEVIGKWTVDYNDYYQFFPEGSEVAVLSGYRLGHFCEEITEWHERQGEPKM